MIRDQFDRVGFVLALVSVAFVQPMEAQTPSLRLLVPAYANPCCVGGPVMWAALTDTAVVMGSDLVLILNPASGPGASPIDPNFVMPSGQGPLIDFRNAGGTVIGYVRTQWAARPMGEVLAEVDRYYDPSFWRGAGVQVQGIFFDEMSNDLADVGYYHALRDHVRGFGPGNLVAGNPGTTFVNNPSGQGLWSVTDYANSADILVTYELSSADYRSDYTPPPWLADYSADHFAHIVYAEIDTDRMLVSLGMAMQRKAGWVYITDDVLPNPYDQLPAYWSREVDAALNLVFADGFESGGLDAWTP